MVCSDQKADAEIRPHCIRKGMPSLYHIDSSVNEGNMGMSNVSSDEESRLIEKLRKIETLFERTTNPGERQAAESALERIRRRLAELEKTERLLSFASRYGI